MKKDKARYMILYGPYPALKTKPQIKINASPWFIVSLSESLNRHQQKCQTDINICCWDGKKVLLSQSMTIHNFFKDQTQSN